jgi:hypothetical protein
MLLLNFVGYVFLLLYLCSLTVMYVLFCIFCFHRANWHSSATLTEVFLCFFLSCKANARVQLPKTGHGPHFSQINCVVVYCLCVNVYCTTATGCQPNCRQQIYLIPTANTGTSPALLKSLQDAQKCSV